MEHPDNESDQALSLLTEDAHRGLQKLQAVATGDASEVLELALLRRQLEHQKQETANAVLAAAELRRQMQEATAAQEKSKSKRLWSAGTPDVPPAQLKKLQGEVERAKSALDNERRARRSELDKASEELEQLRSSMRVSAVYGQPRNRHAGTLRTVFTVLVLAGIAAGIAYTIHKMPIIQAALSVWDVKEVPPAPPPKSTEAIESDTIGKLTSFGGQGSDFSRAIARLDRLLNSLPGKPQDVLRAVKTIKSTPEKTVCGFEWANGQPAIVYEGNKPGNRSLSISATVNNCADAVEQFLASAEKEAAAPPANH